MKKNNYTENEYQIIEYMETEPKSVPNVNEKMSFLKKSVQHAVKSKKQVNFRMNENDLLRLKSQALVE
jgi:predicted DNA binding CopG/RHH family protein